MDDVSSSRARQSRLRWAVRRQAAATAAVVALPLAACLLGGGTAWASQSGVHIVTEPTQPTNCVPDVGVCGYPDAETTGVPATAVLQEVPNQVSSGPGWTFDPRGFVRVFGSGADLTGLLIPYNVTITASNVTLQNDLITHGIVTGSNLRGHVKAVPAANPGLDAAITLRHAIDVTIENTTISGLEADSNSLASGVRDVFGDATGLQILSDDFANTGTAIQASTGLIQGNYIHSEMPGANGGKTYGIEVGGGASTMSVNDNTILVGANHGYAIGLFSTAGAPSNKTITGNVMAGGNYVLYGGFSKGGPDTSNIQVTDNRFSRFFFAGGGHFGPVAHWDPLGPGNIWSGNFWDNTLAAIPEP